jgi:molecular chaperone GrpE
MKDPETSPAEEKPQSTDSPCCDADHACCESAATEGSTPGPETEAAGADQDPLALAQEALKQEKERVARLLADTENQRRRFAREREEIRRTAAAGVIEDLLPALDNLQIGLDAADNHPEAAAVAQGFSFVAQQIRQTLEGHGLSAVNPAQGEAFDPNQHEGVSHEASAEVADNAVIRVQRIGYSLNGRLLRAAMVVVSSGQPQHTDTEAPE